jgi:transcriptional regulator with XRE-family HTH domain
MRGWTQERLASEVGLTQSVLSDIENDKSSPTWKLINDLAQALEFPILSILPVSANNVFPNQSNDSVNNIMNQYGNFEEERKVWQELIKAKDELIQNLREMLPIK